MTPPQSSSADQADELSGLAGGDRDAAAVVDLLLVAMVEIGLTLRVVRVADPHVGLLLL